MVKHFLFYFGLIALNFPVFVVGRSPLHFTVVRTALNYDSTFVNYGDGATKIIDLILETVGVKANFELRRASVPNAAAVVYEGKKYILYNPGFIVAMDKAAGTHWASITVLAHEIGHHLNGHTLDGKGSAPLIELEADEFSGYVLRKLGATLQEAQIAMKMIATTKATRTHPSKKDRLTAIADGWRAADEELTGDELTRRKAIQSFESQGPGYLLAVGSSIPSKISGSLEAQIFQH